MGLSGETYAYWVLHSELTTPTQKAEASVKLAEIGEIRRSNAEGQRRPERKVSGRWGGFSELELGALSDALERVCVDYPDMPKESRIWDLRDEAIAAWRERRS